MALLGPYFRGGGGIGGVPLYYIDNRVKTKMEAQNRRQLTSRKSSEPAQNLPLTVGFKLLNFRGVQLPTQKTCTLPETNELHLKMDG